MDAPVPELAACAGVGLYLLALPWPYVRRSGGDCAYRYGTHAGTCLLQDSAHRARGVRGGARLHCAGAAGDRGRGPFRRCEHRGPLQPGHRLRVLVCAQGCRFHVSVYLVSRNLAALPLRPVDADRMESDAADFARCAGRDRYRGGDLFMNPAMNSGLNAAVNTSIIDSMAPVRTPGVCYRLAGR